MHSGIDGKLVVDPQGRLIRKALFFLDFAGACRIVNARRRDLVIT